LSVPVSRRPSIASWSSRARYPAIRRRPRCRRESHPGPAALRRPRAAQRPRPAGVRLRRNRRARRPAASSAA